MFGEKRKRRESRRAKPQPPEDPRSMQVARQWAQYYRKERARAKARWALT